MFLVSFPPFSPGVFGTPSTAEKGRSLNGFFGGWRIPSNPPRGSQPDIYIYTHLEPLDAPCFSLEFRPCFGGVESREDIHRFHAGMHVFQVYLPQTERANLVATLCT